MEETSHTQTEIISMKKCIYCNVNSPEFNSFFCSSCKEKHDLSDKEIVFLNHFLDISFNEYDDSERSILMSSSAESVIGNCRKIINEIIVKMYSESKEPLDILAVAMTYARMYAVHRRSAIEYFEKFRESPTNIPKIYHFAYSERKMTSGRTAYTLWQIFSKFAKIYEAEKQYAEAIKCLENCILADNGTNPADFERIKKLNQYIDRS